MKTLLLIIPNLGAGGAQKIFRDQYRFYSDHFKTIGCVFNWDGCLPEDRDMGFISLDVPGGRNVFSKAWNFYRRIRKLKAIKDSNKVTHSISHLEGADYVNILSRRDESLFCWIHGTKAFDREIRGALGFIRRNILMRWLYKRDLTMVTVSEGIHREMFGTLRISRERIVTIVNGFSLEQINAKKNESASFSLNSPFLIAHCRLAPQKNLKSFIDIFTLIKKSHQVRLVIVGDGELRDQLTRHAQSNGLLVYCTWRNDPMNESYDVYFLGHQSNPFPVLARATVYAMTSSWEGFPLALGEAMACGVPSIASDCFTGPREILAPGLTVSPPVEKPYFTEYGVLMPLADSHDHFRMWAEAIGRLLDDVTLRQQYSSAGVRRLATLDQKDVSKQWLSLLTK